MELWKQAKQNAKALRAGLRHIPELAGLTHAQFLDMVSRMHGAENWNQYFVQVQRRYFYDRHEPYLPGSTELVRALSVRRAALTDLAQLEAVLNNAGDKSNHLESGLGITIQAIERAFRQARAVFKGKVLVAPQLSATVSRAITMGERKLRGDELFAAQAMKGFMHVTNEGSYQALVTLPESAAQDYHSIYLEWRLTTLAASWAACLSRPQDVPSLAQLFSQGVDLFKFAGEVLDDNEGVSEANKAVKARESRVVGKTVLLSLLANGSMEAGLRYESGLLLANPEILERKLLERFPEIAFWHAWAELKPLLAEGIDGIVK